MFPHLTPTAFILATDELAFLEGKMTEILEDAWDEVSNSITRVTILQGQAPEAVESVTRPAVHQKETVEVKIRFVSTFCFFVLRVPTALNTAEYTKNDRSTSA